MRIEITGKRLRKWNEIAVALYLGVALVLLPSFRSWPSDVIAAARKPMEARFVERMLLENPALVWIAIPALLALANLAASRLGERDPSNRRGRSLAWMGWAMTTVSVLVSTLLFAGRRAVVSHHPDVFWESLRLGTSIGGPLALLFVGLSLWDVYKSERRPLRRRSQSFTKV
jgi:hypothetical protein